MLYVLILPMNSKQHATDTHSNENSTLIHSKLNHTVPVGGNCKNNGDCSPGLKCCDAMGGNKCWECCEDVHCEGLGKICWNRICKTGQDYMETTKSVKKAAISSEISVETTDTTETEIETTTVSSKNGTSKSE